MHTSLLAAAMGLCVALMSACPTATGTDANTIVIGAVVDRTGTNSSPSWSDAMVLAESHWNQALLDAQHRNLQFKLILQDSSQNPGVAVPRAIDVVHNSGAEALISDSSQNDIAINSLRYDDDPSNDLDVPIQCSSCTAGSVN